jgi:hypothetical protein
VLAENGAVLDDRLVHLVMMFGPSELARTFGWPFVWVSAGVLLEVVGSIAELVGR